MLNSIPDATRSEVSRINTTLKSKDTSLYLAVVYCKREGQDYFHKTEAGINSNYESHGNYANLDSSSNKSAEVVKSSTKQLFYNDPLRLLAPYNYVAAVTGEPPNNAF